MSTYQLRIRHLPDAVATIDDDISPSSVRASITGKIHICALQLLRLAITAHGNHALPQILRLLVHEVAQAGINIPRGDRVDSRKSTPLIGQRARQVDTPSLGHVVGSLFLGEVGNVAGHGGGNDQRAGATLFEVVTDGLGAVEGPVEIGLDDFIPVLDGAVQDTRVGGATCVSNESINLTPIGLELAQRFRLRKIARGRKNVRS